MLKELKTLLGIEGEDEQLNEKLITIIDSVRSRLKLLLGGMEVPDEMGHIIVEVAVIRFNRLGSEGMSSHNVEGESISYSENDFEGYMEEIQAFLNTQKEARRGKVRFL